MARRGTGRQNIRFSSIVNCAAIDAATHSFLVVGIEPF